MDCDVQLARTGRAGAAHRRAVTVRVTADTPSTNLVRKSTLALLNMPSLSDTTMNWLYGKWLRIMRPMFCVWLRSSAASTWPAAAPRSPRTAQDRPGPAAGSTLPSLRVTACSSCLPCSEQPRLRRPWAGPAAASTGTELGRVSPCPSGRAQAGPAAAGQRAQTWCAPTRRAPAPVRALACTPGGGAGVHISSAGAGCGAAGGGARLVQDVDGRRLEQQHGQDERQRQQRALPAAQLGQRLLPHAAERHAHLQAWRVRVGVSARGFDARARPA